MSIVADDWLSEQLAMPVHRVAGPAPETLPRGLTFARVDIDDRNGFQGYLRAGFELVVTGVSFECALPLAASGLDSGIRMATAADAAAVRRIASASFIYDHFHADRRLPRERCDSLKGAWAANYFSGQRGDWMVVAESAQGVDGFLLLLAQGDTLVIDLIAVAAPARGRGLAAAMIVHAARSLRPFAKLRVGTQLNNIASVRLYESLGFRLVAAEHVLHRHA